MIPPCDTEGKQISNSVAIKQGIAALLTTSAEAEQKWYDAYIAEKRRAAEAEERAKAEKQRADKAEKEIEYWKKLAQRPKIVFKDNSRLGKLVTGDSNEIYAEDSSIPGQQSPRRISIG